MRFALIVLLACGILASSILAQSSDTTESSTVPGSVSPSDSSTDNSSTIPSSVETTAPVNGSTNTAETDAPTSVGTAGTGSTTAGTQGTGSTAAGTTGTGATGSTGTLGTEGTTIAVTTTTEPINLATFTMSNSFEPLDAELILQQAVQLKNQINSLTQLLQQAKADTDPVNSPLYAQLNAISANLTAQNTTLQGYTRSLATLNVTQNDLDSRIARASSTFVCFAGSSCVTEPPTTPIPTTPGPTPPAYTCDNKNITSSEEVLTYTLTGVQHADCVSTIKTAVTTNSLNLLVNISTLQGNAYLEIIETRTGKVTTFNTTTTTNANLSITTQANIHYYADARATISFSIDYNEYTNCGLACVNGTCRITQSGQQYCECINCLWGGELCDQPINPCQTKQKKLCGSGDYGTCYPDICSSTCYSCSCILNSNTTSQACVKPETYSPTDIPTQPTESPCATTTVTSVLTSTLPIQTTSGGGDSASSTAATETTNPGESTGSTGSTGSSGTDSTYAGTTSTDSSSSSVATTGTSDGSSTISDAGSSSTDSGSSSTSAPETTPDPNG